MRPRWVVDLSLQYGHVVLVSRYLVLTGVNWSQHGCPISRNCTVHVNPGCMSLSTYYWEDGRHVVRLRRRRRAYAPTSNAASHDKHEKINSWVSFSFLYAYGAPLGGPKGHWSSAINYVISRHLFNLQNIIIFQVVLTVVVWQFHSITPSLLHFLLDLWKDRGTTIWKSKVCLLENLNLTPKGD